MKKASELQRKEVMDLLSKCWMTHDGMWFFHCVQALGIEKTNELNKSAITSLSLFEVARLLKILEIETPIENFEAFKSFFHEASELMIPEFMNVVFSYAKENTMAWKVEAGACFAYKGAHRMGVIAQYECGVLHRVKCWLDAVGIDSRFTPDIGLCHMHRSGACHGEIELAFSAAPASS